MTSPIWLRGARQSALLALLTNTVTITCTLVINATAVGAWTLSTGDDRPPPLWVLLPATTLVAVCLPGVRRRAEERANKLVRGERADGYAMMTQLMRRMADTIAVDDVLPRLAEATAQSTRSSSGEVQLWLDDGREQRQVWPPDSSVGTGRLTVDVRHGGHLLGVLAVEAAEPGATRPGLNDLVGPAGLALSTVRLTEGLRARLAETAELNAQLRASHGRILDAGRAQRERVRAELGQRVIPFLETAEQALATTIATLDGTGPAEPGATLPLTGAEDAARTALAALRSLAQGIYPPLLAQAGLSVALRAWADRELIAFETAETEAVRLLQDHPGVQACFYFCCVTILTELKGTADSVPVTASFTCAGQEAGFCLRWSGGSARLGTQAETDITDRLEALSGTFLLACDDPHEATAVGTVPIILPEGRA